MTLKENELFKLILDDVSAIEQKSYTGSYVKSSLKAAKSWLPHNGIEIRRRVKIKGADDVPSLKDERVPTKDELRRIFLLGKKKIRTACALMSHSGLRPMALGNYDGHDGVVLKDFPELRVNDSTVGFEHVPTMVIVRKKLSKGGHQYFSFLSEEARAS